MATQVTILVKVVLPGMVNFLLNTHKERKRQATKWLDKN
jgi:hypothetical protein